MTFWLFYGILTALLLSVSGVLQLPRVILKRGPLYEGIQHLIADEKRSSQMIWNDTQHQIDVASEELHTALNYIQNYETIVDEKLEQINDMGYSDALQQCYTQYERQIARFNRDLITKYRVCRQALNSSLSQLEQEVKGEILYIRDAAIAVHELMYDCNVTDLRRSDEDRFQAARITMCVISKLGNIKQHTFVSTHICLDVIGRIVASDMDQHNGGDKPGASADNVCLEFRNLKEEFESIYERIMICVKDV